MVGELATVELQPLATVENAKEYMWASFRQFQSLVGDKAKCDRFLAIGLHCIEQTPRILDCPRSSFRNSLVEAARLDLEPNSVQQFCWIIPRAQKRGERPIARLEIGYRGLVQLVMRDGGVKKVWSNLVCEGDKFDYDGATDTITHKAEDAWIGFSLQYLVGAYACAVLSSDVIQNARMSREELEAARKLSKSSAYDGPFASEMYKKTPLKRLCKTLPLKDPRIAQAVALEDLHENIVPEPVVPEVVTTAEREHEEDIGLVELPEETRPEINQRIVGNLAMLTELDAMPRLKHPPGWYYCDCNDGTAREFADFLSREVLKAERANR